jgi:tRNA(Ile2) C34 agmatinyltransferase TiaS
MTRCFLCGKEMKSKGRIAICERCGRRINRKTREVNDEGNLPVLSLERMRELVKTRSL